MGKVGTGLLYLFTGGLFGIGAFYDLITLPIQVREANLKLDYRDAMLSAVRSGSSSPINRTASGEARFVGPRKKESLEQIILKTAKINRGLVTPSSVAVASNKSLDEVKKQLDALVEKGYSDLRVSKNGSLVYFFAELSEDGSHPDLEEI